MKRKHRSPAEIARLLYDYHASGCSVKKFSAQHEVSPASFYNWLRRDSKRQLAHCPEVVKVHLENVAPREMCEVIWPNGKVFRFPSTIHPQILPALIAAIEA